MKKFFQLFCLFTLGVSFSQTYELAWNPVSHVKTYGENTAFIPSLQSNAYYLDQNNIPHFFDSEKITGFKYFDIQNIQSKEIFKKDLGEIHPNSLPQSPEFSAKTMKAGNILTKVIDVSGFYKKGNKIYQITSFDVVEDRKQKTINTRDFSTFSPVLASQNGRFFKIKVDTTGVYKIDRNFLTQNGIPTDFNPVKFKIYGNGGMMLPENPGDFRYAGLQENAIYAVGEEDGSFDAEDYFLFYAQGPNGILRNGTFADEHSKNIYEDAAYYFINFESAGNGKRIQTQNIETPATEMPNAFDQILFYEKDSVNVYNVGKQWFGKNFASNNTFSVTFEGSGNISNGKLDYRFLGVNAANIGFQINLDGSNAASGNFVGGNSPEFEISQGSNVDFTANYPLSVNISVDNAANPAGNVYLDYIRLKFKQSLQFANQQLGFRWFQELNENQVYTFNLSGNPEMVWDVSDRVNAKILNANAGSYKFESANTNFPNEFIAFNTSQSFIPEFVQEIENQSLSSLSNIDYVIVTYPEYESQAQRLANVHEQVHGVSTAVVTTEQVYNEFSSGGQDLSGIRDFFKYLYDTGTLKYALLLGDTSYDYKDRIPNNTNRIPAYQSKSSKDLKTSYVTDDFFGILDDTDTEITPAQVDIAVGRLPANTMDEATLLVNKTLSYINQPTEFGTSFGDWRSKIMIIVDDDNRGSGNAFHDVVENLSADYLELNLPQYTLRKLYIDAFLQEGSSGGLRYPAVTDAIVNGVETGTLVVNYFGHGGIYGWAQERIFTRNEINELTNLNTQFSRLPVFVTVTCDFTVWDIPQITSGGELLIKNPEGGAVAMLTTSREIGVRYGRRINDDIIKRLFQVEGDAFLPIGEALRLAKIDEPSTDGLKLNLMGDPLISLARPKRDVTINTINGEPAETFSGTIRALDFVSIEGNVLNVTGTDTDTDFNGTLTATLFDKEVDKTTLNNDSNLDVLTYNEQVDAIYRGSTAVNEGAYTLEFFVPKDINFEVGNGKLLLYAQNGETDGMSYKNDILVGDINPNGIDDDEGPIVGLYMNNLNFANGGITDRSPYLLACVVDSTGINATGAGIGHDITQFLDQDINSTTVLNEYFEGGDASPCINPSVRDFQKGRVYYKLRNLELGEHTVTFKVWDINNNSTTETLDFVVMDNGDQKLYINRLLNWPNPFTNQTFFHFEHNCPDVLEVQVQVFTVSGKLVKTIRQQVSSAPFREGYRTDKFGIPWDGLDDFGNKIGRGVYIYKTTVKGANPESCKGTATETEKLVILK